MVGLPIYSIYMLLGALHRKVSRLRTRFKVTWEDVGKTVQVEVPCWSHSTMTLLESGHAGH